MKSTKSNPLAGFYGFGLLLLVLPGLAACNDTARGVPQGEISKTVLPESFNSKLALIAQRMTATSFDLQDITGLMDPNSCKPHSPNFADTSLEASCNGYLTYVTYCRNSASKCGTDGNVIIDLKQLPDTMTLAGLQHSFRACKRINPSSMQSTYEFVVPNAATGKKASLFAFCGESGDTIHAVVLALKIIGPAGN